MILLMKLFVGLTIAIMALVGAYFFGYPAFDRFLTLRLVKGTTVQPGDHYRKERGSLIKDANGRIKILQTKPALIFSVDEGGGHLGAVGLVYCENTEGLPSFRSHFAEDLTFAQISETWWRYRE